MGMVPRRILVLTGRLGTAFPACTTNLLLNRIHFKGKVGNRLGNACRCQELILVPCSGIIFIKVVVHRSASFQFRFIGNMDNEIKSELGNPAFIRIIRYDGVIDIGNSNQYRFRISVNFELDFLEVAPFAITVGRITMD